MSELLLQELKHLSDEKYRAFSRKIVRTKQEVLGVRLPALRKIAKRIAGQCPDKFIIGDKKNIYEMVMLEGLVLSYLDRSFIDLLSMTENFLCRVDNWAQVDSTVSAFRNISREKNKVLPVVEKWLKSENEFFVRAGLVVVLTHYVEKQNLDMIFDLSQRVSHSGYYAYMANAWLISVCMAGFPEQTIRFFKSNTLDDKTHNKAIQKSRESCRVSKEDKDIINKLKRK
ncbi:MAG: DNA alkylation repair protein [Desulfobacteraceae bacterium]|nr:DNA alkylation repair protein [Desulfobacteraceae bacterium]